MRLIIKRRKDMTRAETTRIKKKSGRGGKKGERKGGGKGKMSETV